MKFVEPNPFTDPDATARKLLEIANATEPAQDGRIYIELVIAAFERPAARQSSSAPVSRGQSTKVGWCGTNPGPI
jgi:hypothetical protein